jgi:UDP-N-acetylmuramoylalanine--D-glutamate ligase
VRISDLAGKRVAVWGYGREGQAALAALSARLPGQRITVFCNEAEAAQLRSLADPSIAFDTAPDAAKLSSFEVIVKSPGISPYTSPAADAALAGTRFVGGTTLWFGEHDGARTICVTGTKGKSTTSALVAHLLRAAGTRTALAGNIGMPMLELLDAEPAPEAWVIELSSFQAGEAMRPDVAVVLNFFPEHLDWHGTEARYFADKMALVTQGRPRVAVLNAADPRLAELDIPAGTHVAWFNHGDGWHVNDNDVWRGRAKVLDGRRLPLPGRHNRVNLCAALAAVEAFGLDARELAGAAGSFRPLPHRLQSLGTIDGIEYVNDSISTTPHASIAALDCHRGRKVAILVGGFDRGIDWGPFVDRMANEPAKAVITMGQNGPRIAEKLRPLAQGGRFALFEAAELEDAVRLARQAVEKEGVVLLSPGAPSFPRYRDYVERGRHFAKVAGFDPEQISAIPGLGVA